MNWFSFVKEHSGSPAVPKLRNGNSCFTCMKVNNSRVSQTLTKWVRETDRMLAVNC